jgi:hypothetical protein
MSVRTIAKLAWLVPLLLAGLSIHQAVTAVQLQKTMDNGVRTWAEVTRYDRSDRKDVTNVEIDLLVHMPDGSQFEHNDLTLPYSIGHRVEADTVDVVVVRGATQEVVFAEVGGTHIRIAWSNFAMSLIAFIMAFVGVYAWNKMLRVSAD